MRATSLKLSAIASAATLAGCVQQPGASNATYTYNNRKYTDAAIAYATAPTRQAAAASSMAS